MLIGLLAGCNAASPQRDPPEAEAARLSFIDVTDEAGLAAFRHQTGAYGTKFFPEAMGAGGGFIDYDGDGWMDIILVGGGVWPGSGMPAPPALSLYRNAGDGTFTDATDSAGLGGLSTYGFGIAASDFDNDGDEDFFFTTIGRDLLFRNDGGFFAEIGEEAGVAGIDNWSTTAIFSDVNLDGHVDLYVGSYVEWSPQTDIPCTIDGELRSYCTPEVYSGVPSRFYYSNGDGTFTEATAAAGFLPAPGKTLGVAEFDYNRDGWPDLVVANDTQPDLLYENDGDGTFTEKGVYSGVAFDENGRPRAGMGIDTGVVDSTGEETVFIGNFSKEMIGVYRHLGNGLFIDRAATSRIGRPSLLTLTFGLFLFDADLDGDLDLFTANGHVQPEVETLQEGIAYREPPHLFVNRGDGTFEDEAPILGGPMTQPLAGRGAAYADYDQDGDLDVLVTENGGGAHLWRNEVRVAGGTNAAGFIRLRLEGRTSNRDALGAQVTVWASGLRSSGRVRTGSSFLSQSEKTLTLGLGPAEKVDSMIVRWPVGLVQRFSDLQANRTYRLIEGDDPRMVAVGPAPRPPLSALDTLRGKSAVRR